MMRFLRVAVAAVLAAGVCGCSVPSLNPLYSKDAGGDDEGLAGAWVAKDGDLTAKVARSAPGEFTVAVSIMGDDADEAPQGTVVTARLVRLGDHLFADVVLHEKQREGLTRAHNFLAVRTYQVLRIRRDGRTLTVQTPSYDRLKSLLMSGEARLAHAVLADHSGGPELVITAPTADLQAFYRTHGADPELFSDALTLTRVE